MKRFIVFFVLVLVLSGWVISCEDDDRNHDAGLVTVAKAKTLRDDTRVTLQGYLVAHIWGERYTFRDDTGEITLEIEGRYMGEFTVSDTIKVEIYGEIDHEDGRIEVDVKSIRKL